MKNWQLPLLLLLLSIVGSISIKSVAPDLFWRQVVFYLGGFCLFVFSSKISFQKIISASGPFYFAITFLLLLLLIIGNVTRGITAWFDIGGGLRFQPSQLAVFSSAAFLLKKFSTKTNLNLSEFVLWLAIWLIPGALILAEPDIGTGFVYLVSVGSILLLYKVPFRWLANLAVIFGLVLVFSWSFVLKPYQKQRITGFMSDSDASGVNYNARQSLIAVGSGQALGRGLGYGVQSHLKFLPERQTDFIFASVGEEWGLIGSIIVVCLYGLLILVMAQRLKYLATLSQLGFVLSVMVMIGVQVGINIGMNLGLIPITGITLPLISYGGSSIISVVLMFGIIQSIFSDTHRSQITVFS